MSEEEEFSKPQEETVLINSVYAENGISAHDNHMHYGTVSMCTRMATELLDALQGLQGTAKRAFDISNPLRVTPITLLPQKQQIRSALMLTLLKATLLMDVFVAGNIHFEGLADVACVIGVNAEKRRWKPCSEGALIVVTVDAPLGAYATLDLTPLS